MPITFLVVLLPLFPLNADPLPQYAPREILVKYYPHSRSKPAVSRLARRVGVLSEAPLLPQRRIGAAKPVRNSEDLEFVSKLRLAPGTDLAGAVKAYQASGMVEYAQPNYLYRTMDAPNDPRFSDQRDLQTINWLAGWELNLPPGKTSVIAIIDSGLDYLHEDIEPILWTNSSEVDGTTGVDDDRNGYVDDIRGWDFTDALDIAGSGDYLDRDNDPMDEGGHGTHVGGIAGAAVDNEVGIAGASPFSRLMALRAGFIFEGSTFLEDDDIAAAIAYAVENGADVINASWGCDEISQVIRDAVRYAARNGVTIVAAAGNEGKASLVYPAALSEVVSVAALDPQGRLASFSSFGEALDLVAPGVGVLSTRLGGGYQSRSGTSQATPFVSGLAAWILALHPKFSPEQVRADLKVFATDLGDSGRDAMFGSGRVDVAASLPSLSAPFVQIITPPSGFGVANSVEVTGVAGETGTAYRLEWGLGTDPVTWAPIEEGAAEGRLQTLGTWTVTGLPDAVYSLRLWAFPEDGTEVESRAILTLDRTPPVFVRQRVVSRLDSAMSRYWVEWATDDRTETTLHIHSSGAITTVEVSGIAEENSNPLPDDLPPGPTSVSLLARSISGLSAQSPDTTFDLMTEFVSGHGFSQVATLPDGYLINRPSDLDGDGRPEIALMPYIPGQPFGRVNLYEKGEEWSLNEIFTSDEDFLPWNVGDVNGNGRQELMGANVGRLRLFEGASAGELPTEAIADMSDTWGGDLADLDADGQPEIVARSNPQLSLRVLKWEGSSLSEVGLLSNPTDGENNLGPRYAIADFDGDSRLEIVSGDSDGDLILFERREDGTYASTWTEIGSPNADARILNGGADLDGDGRLEFIVARTDSLPGDDVERRWIVSVYQSSGDDIYSLEWQKEIHGVVSTGNGVAIGDLTGDGKVDFAVCALPDLYLFTSSGTDNYRAIWYLPVDLTYLPVISDLDENGRPEIAFNQGGMVRLFERDEGSLLPLPPERVRGVAAGPDRILLNWTDLEGVEYRIYRGTSPDSLFSIAEGIVAGTYLDTLLAGERTYFYAVATVEDLAGEGTRSGIVSAQPSGLFSTPLGVEPLSLQHIALLSLPRLEFESAQQPRRYLVLPDSITPSSAILDQDGHRVVLGLKEAIGTGRTYSLVVEGLRDSIGGPLNFPVNRIVVSFSMGSSGPLFAPFDLDRNGQVWFPDFFLFAEGFGTNLPRFDFNGDARVDLSDFFLFAEAFGNEAGE